MRNVSLRLRVTTDGGAALFDRGRHPLALGAPATRTASGAAQALANMGPLAEPAVPALLAALQKVNLVQCRLVAKALSEIGPAALPALGAPITKPQRLPVTSASTTVPPISTEAMAVSR